MKKPGIKSIFLTALMLAIWLVLPACDPLDDIDDKVDRVQNSVDQVDSRLDDLENRNEVDGPIGYETAQELEALVEERRQEYGIPGMVLAIRKSGQATWATAAGYSDLDTRTPMRVDDTFRIGSNSKTFTAANVLTIMHEKGYELDDPVASHLPDLEIYLDDYVETHGYVLNKIHIRHLLQHTSGLLNFTENPEWSGLFLQNPQTQFTPRELLDLADIQEYGPEFAPGKKVLYSNTNYVLLGLLIEEWTNSSYEDEMVHRLIQENGLYNTDAPRTGEYAMAHASPNGFWSEGYLDLNGDGTITADEAVSDQDPSFTWASGNLTSTAEDMLTWVTALGRGEITPHFFSQQQDFRPFVHDLQYGLGLVRDLVDPDNPFDDMIGHQGGTLGYQSVMVYLPYEDAAVVCLYNVTLPPDVKNYAEIVVYDALELVFPGR